MINIIGLLIIVSGFFFPYFIKAHVPSTYFYWLGGLLSLNKGLIIGDEFRWAKWAQIGILINIALVIGMLAIDFLIGQGSITRFEYWLYKILYWMSCPADAIGQYIFPYPETHQPNGSVCFKISYSRTVITAFLNVAIFALILPLINGRSGRTERNPIH
jgi:hypothetical protein